MHEKEKRQVLEVCACLTVHHKDLQRGFYKIVLWNHCQTNSIIKLMIEFVAIIAIIATTPIIAIKTLFAFKH